MSAAFPSPAPSPSHCQSEVDRLRAKVKLLAIAVGILGGVVGGLVCYLVVRHLGASPLAAVGSAGGDFVATAGLVFFIEEKLGLF